MAHNHNNLVLSTRTGIKVVPCKKQDIHICKIADRELKQCDTCCKYCSDTTCEQRCKNDPEKCGQLMQTLLVK